MLWAAFLVITMLLALGAYVVGDYDRVRAALIIATGLILMQAAKVIAPNHIAVFAAAIWVLAGDTHSRLNNGRLPIISVLLVLSGACYAIGRISGEVIGSGAYSSLFADLFGIGALLVIGGPLVVGLGERIFNDSRGRDLGVSSRDSLLHSGRNYRVSKAPKE